MNQNSKDEEKKSILANDIDGSPSLRINANFAKRVSKIIPELIEEDDEFFEKQKEKCQINYAKDVNKEEENDEIIESDKNESKRKITDYFKKSRK